jgi:2-methylcitrate dehydratase PrpD
MDGAVGLRQFTHERISDPEVHQLASRTTVVADPEIDRLRPLHRPAIMEVLLRSGQKFTGRVDDPKGDPRNPMSEEELLRKFEDLAARLLPAETVSAITGMVFDLESIADVSELVQSTLKPS